MYSRRSLSEGRNLFSRLIHLTRAFPNLRLLSFIITWEASCINVCKRTINSDLLCLIGLCSWLNSYRGNFWGNPTKLNFSSQQLSTEKKHPFVLSPFLSQGCEILCQCSPVALSKVHKNREWKESGCFSCFFYAGFSTGRHPLMWMWDLWESKSCSCFKTGKWGHNIYGVLQRGEQRSWFLCSPVVELVV